jgi:hypothetical protein
MLDKENVHDTFVQLRIVFDSPLDCHDFYEHAKEIQVWQQVEKERHRL